MASDGWHLLAPRWAPKRIGLTFAHRALVERVQAHEEAVGSELGQAWCQLVLARIAVVCGRGEAFGDFLSDQDALHDPYMEGMRGYVASEWHRTQGRPLASLQACNRARSVLGADLPDFAGDLLNLAEARAFVALEEVERARQSLSFVAGLGGAIGQEALAVRLETAILSGDAESVERAARRLVAGIRAPFFDAPQAVCSLWAAVEVLENDGRTQAAAECGLAARSAGMRLLSSAPSRERPELAVRLGEVVGLRRDRMS